MDPEAHLESEDHLRDAQFNKAMHGETAKERTHLMALIKKDSRAQKAAVEEYFKYWDDKGAANETSKDRHVLKSFLLLLYPD